MRALRFFPTPSRYSSDLQSFTVYGNTPGAWLGLSEDLAREIDGDAYDFGDVECFWGGEYGDDERAEIVTYDGEIIGSLDRELTADELAECRAYLARIGHVIPKAYARDDYDQLAEHSTLTRRQQGI